MNNYDRYLLNPDDHSSNMALTLNRFILRDIDERLNDLEYKASTNGKKPDVSRADKMALLYELGLLEKLLRLGIPQKKIAQISAVILNASAANIEKDLSTRDNLDAPFKTAKAYQFVIKTFRDLDLEENARKAEVILEKVEEGKPKKA